LRLYIKGDYAKKIAFGYRELAEKMWYVEKNNEPLDISYAGGDEPLQEDFFISLRLNKFGEKWSDIPLEFPLLSHLYETLQLAFEDAFATDYSSNGDCLRIASSHLELLTVDKRAMYIMALEVARAIDGQISEDDKVTWQNPDEFEKNHQDVLSLTYEEATDLSLEEIKTMEVINDPTWAEDDKRLEDYQRWIDENTFGF